MASSIDGELFMLQYAGCRADAVEALGVQAGAILPGLPMGTQTISINVDADAAFTFAAAPPEQRRKVEVLLSLRLQELVQCPPRPLHEIMDEIGAEAAAKGLTPDIVESLLREE